MNIIFFGNGGRSLPCLEILKGLDHHIQVIVAHPDDEVLGMGATIKKLSKKMMGIGRLFVKHYNQFNNQLI